MAYTDPKETFAHFQNRVAEGIAAHFPIKSGTRELHITNIRTKDVLQPDDIAAQHNAKVSGKSFSEPVHATVQVKDTTTGKVLHERTMKIADIPKMTNRFSYIMDGQEYQMDNQWQLRPGIYARRRQNGELESRFNVNGRPSFDVVFDDHSKKFVMEYNKSKMPLYPFMRLLGVSDDDLQKSWGKDIFEANKNARGADGTLERFYKAVTRKEAGDPATMREVLRKHFEDSKLRPEATEITVGKPLSHVSGDAFKLATEKLLKVQGGHPEDNRDALIFKDLRMAGDYAHDKLSAFGKTVRMRVQRKLATTTDPREILPPDLFNVPIKQAFHKNAAARVATQINPLEMISGASQTTIMGSGGIQSDRSVTQEAKLVDPSQIGYLDPLVTPEGGRTGISLRLPIGAHRDGGEIKVPLYNIATGKLESLSPIQAYKAKVVLPDQVTWENGKPKPIGERVKISAENNEVKEAHFGEATHVMRHPSQMFSLTANLIPFLGNTSGNRAGMAARHMEQAISLKEREVPLVQVGTGSEARGMRTFEEFVGGKASHKSPVDGTVVSVQPTKIVVQDGSGKKHEVQLYKDYPLNDAKSGLNSEALVKVGDKVSAGHTLADTNYTKGGTLALGKNLRVAYLPFRGLNFEDALVVSESAAKSMTSVHLSKPEVAITGEHVLDKNRFKIHFPEVYKPAQLDKLDNSGIVRVGQRVAPGDPLVVTMKPFDIKHKTGLGALKRWVTNANNNASLTWDSEHPGEVVAVHRTADGVRVHVRTEEPIQAADKMAFRYGNKGVVAAVIPDAEMPKDKSGKPVEVLLGPTGVGGRVNLGQIFETAASKVALKTGKPLIVENFRPHQDSIREVKNLLQKHGLSDTEELFDPQTGKSLGHIMTGYQYGHKLVHQAEKKQSARSGMASIDTVPTGETWDLNLQPVSGGHTGGQAVGALGIYALLAHGAKHNLREMQTLKGEGADPQTDESKRWPSLHEQTWQNIQMGLPIPTPKSTFIYQKFTDMLRGAGVNVDKKGHELMLSPMTDKHIMELTGNRVITRPGEAVDAKNAYKAKSIEDLKPRAGGIFDEKLTGGHGGRLWSRLPLAEPTPNPMFERPIQVLTGLSVKDYDAIMAGTHGLHNNKVVPVGAGVVTGGAAIKQLLTKIDVKAELDKAKKDIKVAKPADLDTHVKKAKYLQALHDLNMQPADAYVLHNLPIIPPVMRPTSMLPSGDIKTADINTLYMQFGQLNEQLGNPTLRTNLTEARKANLRSEYYNGLRAIMGVGVPYAEATSKGLLHTLSGSSPKQGLVQDQLIAKRQDLSMRAAIIPGPHLELDEIGMPRSSARTLFAPFTVRKLVELGHARTPLEAQKLLAQDVHTTKNEVTQALEKVMAERPVLVKRDPALHKYSIQGFNAKLSTGNALQLHPLATVGFNADFDGDTMSVYVPVTAEAVQEAHKLKPSKNLFSPATGELMFKPTLEYQVGLYKLGKIGKDTSHSFKHPADILHAAQNGKISMTDVVDYGGKKTTAGRIILATGLPEPMQQKIMHDFSASFNKAGSVQLLSELGKNHPEEFGLYVNRLKNLGSGAASGSLTVPLPKPMQADHTGPSMHFHVQALTLGLNDLEPDRAARDKALAGVKSEVDKVHKMSLPSAEKDRRLVELYTKAGKDMQAIHLDKPKESHLHDLLGAGVKPTMDQYKQMVLAPMLMMDSRGQVISTPITRSYAEGVDVAGYWIGSHGARRGAVRKVQEVQEPGYLSKLLINTTMDQLVAGHDCGTKRGIDLSVQDKSIHDRHLARPFSAGSLHIPEGTLLTPTVVGQIRAVDKNATLSVRSPLKCEHEKGICQKCAGIYPDGKPPAIGTNVGIMASQAIGERATQLTLKEFHSGGVAGAQGKATNLFVRFQHLTQLPQKIPNAATLAMVPGTVQHIEQDSTGTKIIIDGHAHHVGKDHAGNSLAENIPGFVPTSTSKAWEPPKVGMRVRPGDVLSDPNRTFINPHDLYKATGNINKVQQHLVEEMHGIYKDEKIDRRHVELLVRAMGSVTKVTDPGDHPDVLRGEFRPTWEIQRINKDLMSQNKQPIAHSPVLKGISELPLLAHDDWLAKLQHKGLRATILDAAARGAKSDIHGAHPIPGLAFGAEFGLGKADALRPGMGHLSTVNKVGY